MCCFMVLTLMSKGDEILLKCGGIAFCDGVLAGLAVVVLLLMS